MYSIQPTKFYLDSQTIRNLLGLILPLLAFGLQAFGIQFTPDDQNDLIDIIINLVAAVSGAYFWIQAFVGRFKADQPLRGTK